MFQDNFTYLRKMNKLTQEALAEKLNVSRQTVSKWETGDSVPDILQCSQLAAVFGVTLDDLVNYSSEITQLPMPPRGKHAFGMVKVGDKGQIVIPAKARKIFDIHPGDSLFVLGDETQGLAIIKEKSFLSLLAKLREN